MTRLISAAGLAVYAFAVSTAVLPEQEEGAGFGWLVSTAAAAESGQQDAAAATPEEAVEAAPVTLTGTAAPAWDADSDGMLTAGNAAPSPFDVLNPI